MKKLLTLILGVSFLSACAGQNNFQAHYQPVQNSGYEICQQPQVRALPEYKDYDRFISEMYEDGYVPIGNAQWEGGKVNAPRDAYEQALAVQACLVLWREDFSRTEQGTRTETDFIPGKDIVTTRSDGTQVVTHIPGEYRSYEVPYSRDKFFYSAIFFAKDSNNPSGLRVTTPPEKLMRKLDSRAGLYVQGVRNGSPAYRANIFSGDVILRINGKEVYADTPLDLRRGGSYNLVVYRNGKRIKKELVL